MERRALIARAELVQILRRAGYPVEVSDEIASRFPDPLDPDRESPLLQRYGVTRERLVDQMGGSP
jgi:hypothetical protein